MSLDGVVDFLFRGRASVQVAGATFMLTAAANIASEYLYTNKINGLTDGMLIAGGLLAISASKRYRPIVFGVYGASALNLITAAGAYHF